jgi:DNA-directed RNA polymerase subunit K/omega
MYERAIEKLGGAFKLTVLVQKRVREIIRGASPLVPVTSDMSPIDIALKEILEDKIGLTDDLLGIDGEKDADGKAEGKEEKKSKAKSKKKKSDDGADDED